MVFSGLVFMYAFFPLCLLFYFVCPKLTYRNIVLVIFSLLFYAWGEPVYVFLMIASSFFNYLAGIAIDKANDRRRLQKGILIASVIINLGALVFFKYTGFIMQNLGLDSSWFNVTLPIGISFYTFQALSYVVDVYAGSVPAQKSFYKILLYISLFPQLIAGPIVRYEDVEKEIRYRKTNFGDLSSGVTRFCIGLGKKVLIANQCGSLVTKIFELKIVDTTVLGTWLGILMFAIQIYFDFSGYSDMAIGLGRIFGFHYKENFNYPYISRSVTEFWRRWHISLGSFFRDYVYIPLGGNRRHMWLNLFVVWFLTGLWHGASWNFVLWGLMYGILICIEKLVFRYLPEPPKFMSVFSYVYMFFVTSIGWTIFYFTDMSALKTALSAMFLRGEYQITNVFVNSLFFDNIYVFVMGLFFSLPFAEKVFMFIRSRNKYVARAIEIIFNVAVVFLSTVMLAGDTYNPFLYFRF